MEIISVDSALVYRGMDIQAPPNPPPAGRVPHHLIDLIRPTAAYSAAEFVADARQLIGEIRARRRCQCHQRHDAFYLKALFDGLDELPPLPLTLRAENRRAGRARSAGRLRCTRNRAASTRSPAARSGAGDAQRIQRALEVWR